MLLPNIRNLSKDALLELIISKGEKKFRAQQAHEWIWQKGANGWSDLKNLPKPLLENLANEFSFPALQTDMVQESSDGTIKARFVTYDGHFIEGVLIPTDERKTACVSSQIGCSLTCKFCATGTMERKRNLEFDEIVDQVFALNKISLKKYGKKLTNIVFMGMGEPLLNYKNVLKAIEKISDPDCLAMSPRRITVSTAGVSKMIEKLGDDEVKFKLALSLHAPTDEKRDSIMPINDSNNIETLIKSLNYFYQKTKNEITLEYILLKNFNDSEEDALELIKLFRKIPSDLVNIIEYNPVSTSPFERTETNKTDSFMAVLSKNRVNARLRRSRGKDIDAACGQLANKAK